MRCARGAGGNGEHRPGRGDSRDDTRGRDDALGDEQADGDGQVVERAFLADLGRGEIDEDAPGREIEARVHERRLDPLDGLLDSDIGETDHCCAVLGVAHVGVDLDLAREGVDAVQDVGLDSGEHEQRV